MPLCVCVFDPLVTKNLGPKPFPLLFRPHEDLLARAIAQGPKTVDVPASLPTPPHNAQEELRCVQLPFLEMPPSESISSPHVLAAEGRLW